MMSTEHLAGRCGTCRHWNSVVMMGVGYCELAKEVDSPIRASDYGCVETRIDFGCLAHEVTPVDG